MRLLLYPKRQSTEEERMEPFELNLWPDGPTYTFKPGGEEIWSDDFVMPREGVVNRVVQYVNEPTLKVFPAPTDRATGAAAIVAPGGGYSLLAMDKEGYDVAAWLNTMGVTAAVLKYRVRPNPEQGMGLHMPPAVWGAILSDGQRAVRTVRARAAEWGIDPQRIGMFGFSAGGHLTASTTFFSDAGDPEADDPAERVSSRPDFIGLMYGAFASWPEQMPESLPPLFMTEANNDGLFSDADATWIKMARTWAQAGVPFEVHHYAQGGHGFGMGVHGGAVAGWPAAFAMWLKDMGVLG
jgi:acetyl esterase/lipase